MQYNITILGEKYEIIDSIEYITLADSFVKNKIGTGHGEAKLYVGNENERLFEFFEDFNGECFFCKNDFQKFLLDAEPEFINPQQEYVKKTEMPTQIKTLFEKVGFETNQILKFQLYRVNVAPPRVYVNSASKYYELMRDVGLPNISYLSILKIKNKDGKILYYFKIFIDYKSDIIKYVLPEEAAQEEIIVESKLSPRKKEMLIQARIGQGEYRRKLLDECSFCPFTEVNDERLLVASHIKPWAKSDDKEKIDPKNGFMLTPTFDKLFDRGFISFEDNGSLLVSPWLSPMNQKRLAIYTSKRISKLQLDEKRLLYLEYHRKNVFKG